MKPTNKTANDLFELLRTQFSPVTLGNEDAEVTSDPGDARFFSFIYKEGDSARGTVSISIVDSRTLKVYYNHDMIENITITRDWYNVLKQLRFFAKQNLMGFDARDIQKDQLDTRDYNFIKVNDGPYKEDEVEITESKMYGSKRKSKQQFENATLVVYHKKAVDEEVRGSRSRHIDRIFIESNGEKFRFPINYLNGARAMAVHVSEGGTPYDVVGKHIISTVEEMRNLSQFARITRKHAMEDEEASGIRSRVVEAYQSIRKDIMRMQNVNNYRNFVETFEPKDTTANSDVNHLQEKFTVKVWNEKMDDLLPSVQRALEKTNEDGEMTKDSVKTDALGLLVDIAKTSKQYKGEITRDQVHYLGSLIHDFDMTAIDTEKYTEIEKLFRAMSATKKADMTMIQKAYAQAKELDEAVSEGSLKNMSISVREDLHDLAQEIQKGMHSYDAVVDELNDMFDAVKTVGDPVAINAFKTLRSLEPEDFGEGEGGGPNRASTAAQDAMDMIDGEDDSDYPHLGGHKFESVKEASMGAPDYNPAAGQYSSNMEYGMFTPAGNEEVEEIVQAACDMVKSGEHDTMSATDAAMEMLTQLAETSSHDEAEDTEVREKVSREIASRCDSMNEEEVDENAFNQAAAAAARSGKDSFEFNGKTYKTKMDKDTANKLDEASPSVEKTIKDPNFVLVLKKDEAADSMLRRTKFKTAQGLLAFAMADIASRIIGSNSDAVANFASDMMINVGEEGESFGTRMTPEYKRDKQLAMMLAKKYIDDIKRMATDDGYADEVRKDPADVYGNKKKRTGGFHEAFEDWANDLVEATTSGTIGTSGTVRQNQQVVKALAGGDAAATQQVKRIGDKLVKGQKLTPAEMPVASEIAKKLMTTKKTSAAMQALANGETNTPEDGEVAITEKQLKVKADRDYDDDGKIESPRDEYMGSKDKAIKKSMKKRPTAEETDDLEDERLFQESLNLLRAYVAR